jgi:hypothetical protein
VPEQNTIAVPSVVNKKQPDAEAALKAAGLDVGDVTTSPSSVAPAGNVISTDPATGTQVNTGSAVALQVSSGVAAPTPPAAPTSALSTVAVPDITGLTQTAAIALIKNVGLTVGSVTTQTSSTTPSGGVERSAPSAGTQVRAGSSVDLVVSSGPKLTSSQIATIVAALCIFGVIIFGIFSRSGGATGGTSFLGQLAQPGVARGLITFLIAFTTVSIAVVLAISTLFLGSGNDTADAARFDRGKQVLTTLIGILGTIVGFYYGSAIPNQPTQPATELTITTMALPDGVHGAAYQGGPLQASGGTPPLKWSVSPALPADLALDATGSITGKPTAITPAQPYTFTVTDSAVPPILKTQAITFAIK